MLDHIGLDRMRLPLAIAVAVGLILFVAAPAGASPGRYVIAAKGVLDGAAWSFSVRGGDGQRCYSGRQERLDVTGAWNSGAATCHEAREPSREWQHILGLELNAGGGGAELQQTSARVHFLELLLSDPFGGDAYEPEWRSLRTRALTAGQRAKAKLGPGYRFAALASLRPFCITAVRTFDREREPLRERKVPCEY